MIRLWWGAQAGPHHAKWIVFDEQDRKVFSLVSVLVHVPSWTCIPQLHNVDWSPLVPLRIAPPSAWLETSGRLLVREGTTGNIIKGQGVVEV